MAYKEKEIEKLYYSIGEVSSLFNVNNSLLRHWETEFDELKPKKGAKGTRFYTKKEIETIRLIYHLVKEQGHTLEGARQKLKEGFSGEADKLAAIEKLEKVKAFLQELKDKL